MSPVVSNIDRANDATARVDPGSDSLVAPVVPPLR